jgi:hypothetical protein
MTLDARVEHAAHQIVYHVQSNESIHLSDKSRHDVFSTVRSVADYWRADSERLRKENHAKRWNELRIWLRENPTASVSDIESIMLHLDAGDYVRDIRVK